MNMPPEVINIEYLDTKRIDPNQTRLEDLRSLYLKKYKGKHFNLIIASITDACKQPSISLVIHIFDAVPKKDFVEVHLDRTVTSWCQMEPILGLPT